MKRYMTSVVTVAAMATGGLLLWAACNGVILTISVLNVCTNSPCTILEYDPPVNVCSASTNETRFVCVNETNQVQIGKIRIACFSAGICETSIYSLFGLV